MIGVEKSKASEAPPGPWSDSVAADKPGIPLCPGLTIVTAIASDYDYESPYNTYLHEGLPPGPICSPGADALRAAVNPARTAYLYFVADPTNGGHTFSATFEDHLVAIAMAKKARAQAGAANGETSGAIGPTAPVTPPEGTKQSGEKNSEEKRPGGR